MIFFVNWDKSSSKKFRLQIVKLEWVKLISKAFNTQNPRNINLMNLKVDICVNTMSHQSQFKEQAAFPLIHLT